MIRAQMIPAPTPVATLDPYKAVAAPTELDVGIS